MRGLGLIGAGSMAAESGDYASGMAKQAIMRKQPSMKDRLEMLKADLEGRLADVNAALKLVEDNPTLVDFIAALEKVNVGY